MTLKKGNKRKTEIQQAAKALILTKGYPQVTMSDIGERLNLSAGGLYYHYHSIEEIFLDILQNETSDIWHIFEEVNDIESLITTLNTYKEIEKSDLLNVENTLNSMIYQYYFSFPAEIRKSKMSKDYTNTMNTMTTILSKVYTSPKTIEHIRNHIYIMLHGLNTLAMSGQLKSSIIDYEFKETEALLYRLYTESEKEK